ncbi:hypothetical protein NEOLEDRAFT_1245242 [Neolentinus lepideus HHB14362 ss-1]|uniref:BTB domain-containing protein n=1 Tax=Neolentinus lepideus HHB14362 ss-1 TaxID=1314782 RepID=A0A165P0F1_9AGAM|nr:hypothetical protein NEOLEDRAFT_1245242 [Neolentinus lepideus HHB14362 ss-1]
MAFNDSNDSYYSRPCPCPPSYPSRHSSASSRSSKSHSPSSRHTKSPITPPKTPPRLRRPSLSTLSNPMNWLGRSSSSDSANRSAPYGTSVKPVRISEPKLNNSLEIWAAPRCGTLGSGATVVRTPQEALIGSSARVSYGSSNVGSMGKHRRMKSDDSIDELYEDAEEDLAKTKDNADLPSPPDSPPLPPLPLFATKSSPDLPLSALPSTSSTSLPMPPTRPPPSPPTRPALKNARASSSSPPSSAYFPPVPPVPAHLVVPAAQPSFEAILVSAVSSAVIDPIKTIVTLETNTMTYRTSFMTLMSQPSNLASYLKSILPKNSQEDDEDEDVQSMHSFVSDAQSSFNSIFHHHLTASGLLSQSAFSIHIFLDRPSTSYAHILAYLRAPTLSLPRPVQLSSCSSRTDAAARLEALLDLRDEATYLGLDDLQKLCTEEIRSRYTLSHVSSSHIHRLSAATATSENQYPTQPMKHHRGGSTTSVHSMQTLREEREEDKPTRKSRSRERSESVTDTTTTTVPGLRDRPVRSMDDPRSPGLSMSQSVRTAPAANWI